MYVLPSTVAASIPYYKFEKNGGGMEIHYSILQVLSAAICFSY